MVLLVSIKGVTSIFVFVATGFHGTGTDREGQNWTGPASSIHWVAGLHCPNAGILTKGIISNLLANGLAILVVVRLEVELSLTLVLTQKNTLTLVPLNI